MEFLSIIPSGTYLSKTFRTSDLNDKTSKYFSAELSNYTFRISYMIQNRYRAEIRKHGDKRKLSSDRIYHRAMKQIK